MIKKNKLFTLVHTKGSQVGCRWPAIYQKEVQLEPFRDSSDGGKYHEFVYLQGKHMGEYRLAKALVRDGNFIQNNIDITILDHTKTAYTTGERPYNNISALKYWILLSRLVLQHKMQRSAA